MSTSSITTPNTAAMPADPKERPCGPDTVTIEPHHLSITQEWDSGSSHNIHLLENGDLSVILLRGQDGRRHSAHCVPADPETGTVLVLLGVDDDHDEVHFSARGSIDAEEVLGQALEALLTCRHSLSTIRRSEAHR